MPARRRLLVARSHPWAAVAQDAGVPAEGTGFRGVTLHCLLDSRDAVDRTLRTAVAAGGVAVKPAEVTGWGGYEGYFSDPDGHLWKVATTA